MRFFGPTFLLAAFTTACGGSVDETASEVRVREARFFMDCMPVHGPDTAGLRLTVEYTNATDRERIWTIDAARLEFSDEDQSGTLLFPVVPNTSGLVRPGERLVIEHVKQPGTGTGTPTCGFCNGDSGRWELFVTWSTPSGTFERRAGSGISSCSS